MRSDIYPPTAKRKQGAAHLQLAVVSYALLNPEAFVQSSGYLAIFVLSVLQSCCVPTSSEITLGIAGVLAAEGKLSLPGAIAVGAAGEVVGAYIAWAVGRAGGRGVVDRFGRYILLSHRDLDRAEAWYQRRGPWGVFASRLVPLVRNFVALPAGIAEVPALRFGLLTAAGSLVWDSAMALIGYEVGGSFLKVAHRIKDVGYGVGVLVVIGLAYVIWHRWRSYREATAEDQARRSVVGARLGDEAPEAATAPGAAPGRPAD